MVTTRPPKTIVKPTALGPVANTDTKLLIYGLFQKGRVLAQDGEKQIGCAYGAPRQPSTLPGFPGGRQHLIAEAPIIHQPSAPSRTQPRPARTPHRPWTE